MVHVKSKGFDIVKWIANMLVESKSMSPRVIIYCRTVTLAGWLYSKFLHFLKQSLPLDTCKLLMGLFHRMTLSKNKDIVLSSLTSNNHVMRLVIATSSLGCGVNTRGVKYVIHFGPSYDLVDYCQQIRRAGRDNQDQCHAILNTYSKRSSKVSSDKKFYMKSSQCLRLTLYSRFV